MTEMNQKRFTGEGPTASEDYRRFKKWVQSHIFYKKVDSEAQGPFLYTLLDGEALAAVDELEFSSYAAKDGIDILWRALDSHFPQKAPIDSMGEALGEVFHLQASPGETMAAWTGRATQVFVTCRTKRESNSPAKLKAGFSCIAAASTTTRKQWSRHRQRAPIEQKTWVRLFEVVFHRILSEENGNTSTLSTTRRISTPAESTVEAFEDVETFLAEGRVRRD